jgi:uncharacterized cupredoxin-like copper-binding protein
MLRSSTLGLVILLSLVGALAAACGSGRSDAAGPAARTVLSVAERDFAIDVSSHRVAAGKVLFTVTNKGPDRHELIVVRDDNGLRLRSDGMTVDEEALASRIVGALEPGPTGDVRSLTVDLRPGRYMVLCNMFGHYMGGMHSVVLAS